ncbi:MAG: hypothetical protein ACLU84_01070 [Clostridia bacterium]
MYSNLRMIFILILFILFIVLCKKRKKEFSKNIIIISIVFSAVVYIALYFFPIENLFYTFSSVQEVFNYQFNGEILDTINGNNSTMVVYSTNNNTYSYAVIPKNNNGWKIGTSFSLKKILQENYGSKIITIYKYQNSDDYYVIIADPIVNKEDNFADIYDNQNSVFNHITNDLSNTNKKSIIYYAYVNKLEKNYLININSKALEL